MREREVCFNYGRNSAKHRIQSVSKEDLQNEHVKEVSLKEEIEYRFLGKSEF